MRYTDLHFGLKSMLYRKSEPSFRTSPYTIDPSLVRFLTKPAFSSAV